MIALQYRGHLQEQEESEASLGDLDDFLFSYSGEEWHSSER